MTDSDPGVPGFRDWYRATPPDPDRVARILMAVRSLRSPRRAFWTRAPIGLRLAAAAGIGAAVLAAGWWWAARAGDSRMNREVQFLLVAPAASTVAVVGDFNGWDATATPMRRTKSDEPWVVTVALPPGRRLFAYAFIVDGARWLADPNAPLASGDDFGSPTSVLVLREEGTM